MLLKHNYAQYYLFIIMQKIRQWILILKIAQNSVLLIPIVIKHVIDCLLSSFKAFYSGSSFSFEWSAVIKMKLSFVINSYSVHF